MGRLRFSRRRKMICGGGGGGGGGNGGNVAELGGRLNGWP